MKFEVGKRYYREVPEYFWWCVGFSRSGEAVFESDASWRKSGPVFTQEGHCDWQEYKDSKVHKAQVHWFKTIHGDVCVSTHQTVRYKVGQKLGNSTVIHVQEVEYKET